MSIGLLPLLQRLLALKVHLLLLRLQLLRQLLLLLLQREHLLTHTLTGLPMVGVTIKHLHGLRSTSSMLCWKLHGWVHRRRSLAGKVLSRRRGMTAHRHMLWCCHLLLLLLLLLLPVCMD